MFSRVFVFGDMIALYQVLADAGLRRSKTDASPRTVYLTPVAMAHPDAIRPDDADGSEPVFGLSESSISRRVKAAARAAGLGGGYSGHSGRVGMARRMARAGAPTHEIMAQRRHGRRLHPG